MMNTEVIGKQDLAKNSPEQILRGAIENTEKNNATHREQLMAHRDSDPESVKTAFETVRSEYKGDEHGLGILNDIERKVFGEGIDVAAMSSQPDRGKILRG